MKTQVLKSHVLCIIAAALAIASCEKTPEQDKPEEPASVKPTSIAVVPSEIVLTEGESESLSVTVLPENATYSAIQWSSSDDKVASVANGTVTAKSAGTATITASTEGIKGTAKVTVKAKYIPVTGISLDKTELTLTEGGEATLVATVIPDNATDKTVSWLPKDETIATVDQNGKITALQPGETIIEAVAHGSNLADNWTSAECKLKVEPKGVLPGYFSVAKDKKIRFSKGNLRYIVDTKEWGFFDNQYDFVKTKETDIISLFNWGYNAEKSIVPNATYDDNVDIEEGNLSQEQDWGCTIGNGKTWRTPTSSEWKYLLNDRGKGDTFFRLQVKICGQVCCLVIAPDGNETPIAEEYDETTWAAAEAAGFVCLAPAGYRDYYQNVCYPGLHGSYWSSTLSSWNKYADCVSIRGQNMDSYGDYARGWRYNGQSVRLITEF